MRSRTRPINKQSIGRFTCMSDSTNPNSTGGGKHFSVTRLVLENSLERGDELTQQLRDNRGNVHERPFLAQRHTRAQGRSQSYHFRNQRLECQILFESDAAQDCFHLGNARACVNIKHFALSPLALRGCSTNLYSAARLNGQTQPKTESSKPAEKPTR